MSPIEGRAIHTGSNIQRSIGAGLSHSIGSVRVDPEKLAYSGFLGGWRPLDEYIPSNPEFAAYIRAGFTLNILQPPDGDIFQNAQDMQDAGENDENGGADETAAGEFTPEEQRVINDLKTRDREVRDHEQAHISVGGAYIRGGAAYEYESGPDNKRYAVGGEVSIDASPVRDNPEATVMKMRVVRAAALAPANPSGQDRAVASSASRQEAAARADLAERRAAEIRGDVYGSDSGNAAEVDNRQPSRVSAAAMSVYARANPLDAQMLAPLIDYAV